MKTALLCLSVLFAGCIIDDPYYYDEPAADVVIVEPTDPYYQSGSELTVMNDSSYDFYEIALSRVGSAFWSEDFLRGNPLFPGESITIADMGCARYDILIVDHTGTACELYDFDLCLTDHFVAVNDYDMSGANCY
jgi:hypothetical protein